MEAFMKKIKLLAVGLVILVALGMGFTSCGDDEDVYGTLRVVNQNPGSELNASINTIVKIEVLDADGLSVVASESYAAGSIAKGNSAVFSLLAGTYKLRIDMYNSAGWTMKSAIQIEEGEKTIDFLIDTENGRGEWPYGTLNIRNEDTTPGNSITIVEVLKSNGSLQGYHLFNDNALSHGQNKDIDIIPNGTYRLRVIWNDGSKWINKSTFTINSDDGNYGLTTVDFSTTANTWEEAPEVSIDDINDPDYEPVTSGVRVYNRNSTPAGNYIAKIVVLESDGTTEVSTHPYSNKFTKDVYAEIDLNPGSYKLKITRGGGSSTTWAKQSTFTVTADNVTIVDFYVASDDWK
jgi:major membrane immunogen (membrane-anchored lipoprotein)